jgi:NhaP-type Na+/H+ or K+/H+ antiporter
MLDISATCLVVTALLAYVNQRYVGLPTTIGVMVTALALSLLLVGLDAVGLAHGLRDYEASLIGGIDFSDPLMQGMLSLLLFAGALHVDLSELRAYRWQVGGLAVVGTLLSTLLVGLLLTLAAVMGGYALASRLQVSGPLAMVAAGLVIGNQGRALAMSDTTRHHVDLFWELIDEILNAVLFVLIGMEVILIRFPQGFVWAALTAIGVTLLARWLTVGWPVELLPRLYRLPPSAGRVLTWGGLRGGISVALCLSLPAGPQRELLLAMTYCVVVCSILGQGLTIGRVVRSAISQPQRR